MFLTETEPPRSVESPHSKYFFELVKKNLNLTDGYIGKKSYVHYLELSGPAEIGIKVQTFEGISSEVKVKKLEEYADYIQIGTTDSTRRKIAELAQRCAGCYNALQRQAAGKGGHDPVTGEITRVTVVGLFTNNLRFNLVVPGPSVSDPLETPKTWIAFRFKFAYITTESA